MRIKFVGSLVPRSHPAFGVLEPQVDERPIGEAG